MKNKVLLICGSRKPARGKHTPSAVRELLKIVDQGIVKNGGTTTLIDLRNKELPFFDGREPEEYTSKDLISILKAIKTSSVIVISVPAYWAGTSGVIKNLFDLLGGPKYHHAENQPLPLEHKLVALLIVGDDEISSSIAVMQMRQTINSLGGWVLPQQVVIGNPQQIKDISGLFVRLEKFGKDIWRSRKIQQHL